MFILVDPGLGNRMSVTMNYGTDTAARAQDVGKAIGPQQMIGRVYVCRGMNSLFSHGHDLIISRIASGVGIAPPAWFSLSTGSCVSRSISRRN